MGVQQTQFSKVHGKEISRGLKCGLFEGYLWWLKNARIRVQSPLLVEIELCYETKSKWSNRRAQLMCVWPHDNTSDFKMFEKSIGYLIYRMREHKRTYPHIFNRILVLVVWCDALFSVRLWLISAFTMLNNFSTFRTVKSRMLSFSAV